MLCSSVLAAISVGGATYFHKRRVYRLLHATYVAMFHCVYRKIFVRAIRVLMSPKLYGLAGAVVQRSYLVMMALTLKQFCVQYGWFVMEGRILLWHMLNATTAKLLVYTVEPLNCGHHRTTLKCPHMNREVS